MKKMEKKYEKTIYKLNSELLRYKKLNGETDLQSSEYPSSGQEVAAMP